MSHKTVLRGSPRHPWYLVYPGGSPLQHAEQQALGFRRTFLSQSFNANRDAIEGQLDTFQY